MIDMSPAYSYKNGKTTEFAVSAMPFCYSILAHGLLIAGLMFSVTWKAEPETVLQAEIWDSKMLDSVSQFNTNAKAEQKLLNLDNPVSEPARKSRPF